MPSCGGESCSCEPWVLELSQPDTALHVWEGQEFSYQPTYNATTCSCAGPLVFSAEGLPTGLEIDAASGLIRGSVDYSFTNLTNPEVEVVATVRLEQQDMCSGTVHQVNVPFVFIVHNSNRLRTLDSFVLVNLTDPARVNAPRTKDLLRAEASGITDPDGDPVSVQIEWQVNGTTLATTQGAVSLFDLSQPGHGDLGDQISAVVQLDDGTGWTQLASISLVVDNSPPVIRGAEVSGEQAIEDGTIYFVESQYGVIRISAHDDDVEQSPERDSLYLVPQGELPPGLEIDVLGLEARGQLRSHDGPNPTKFYNFALGVRDSRFASPACLWFPVGLTSLRVHTVVITGLPAGHGPTARIPISASRPPVTFTFTITGVGASAAGSVLLWTVYESDWGPDDELWKERDIVVFGAGATGAFTVTRTFWLFVNRHGYIAGPDDSSGEATPDHIRVLVESGEFWSYGRNLGVSNDLWVEAAP